eukprot:1004314_1
MALCVSIVSLWSRIGALYIALFQWLGDHESLLYCTGKLRCANHIYSSFPMEGSLIIYHCAVWPSLISLSYSIHYFQWIHQIWNLSVLFLLAIDQGSDFPPTVGNKKTLNAFPR